MRREKKLKTKNWKSILTRWFSLSEKEEKKNLTTRGVRFMNRLCLQSIFHLRGFYIQLHRQNKWRQNEREKLTVCLCVLHRVHFQNIFFYVELLIKIRGLQILALLTIFMRSIRIGLNQWTVILILVFRLLSARLLASWWMVTSNGLSHVSFKFSIGGMTNQDKFVRIDVFFPLQELNVGNKSRFEIPYLQTKFILNENVYIK